MRDLKVASHVPRPQRSSIPALLGTDFPSAPGARPRVRAAQRGRAMAGLGGPAGGADARRGPAIPARSGPAVPAWGTAHPRSPAPEGNGETLPPGVC